MLFLFQNIGSISNKIAITKDETTIPLHPAKYGANLYFSRALKT